MFDFTYMFALFCRKRLVNKMLKKMKPIEIKYVICYTLTVAEKIQICFLIICQTFDGEFMKKKDRRDGTNRESVVNRGGMRVAYYAVATLFLFSSAIMIISTFHSEVFRSRSDFFVADIVYDTPQMLIRAENGAIENNLKMPDFLIEQTTTSCAGNESFETDEPFIEPEPIEEYMYIYSNQVQKSERVEDGFFSDALFVGDSRTVGFCNYTAITNYCCAKVSLNVRSALTNEYIEDKLDDGSVVNCTLVEYLSRHANEFSRVYICFGTNETVWNDASFIVCYETLVENMRKYLPNDTPIYIQSILPVNERIASNYKYAVSNEIAVRKNMLLAEMCSRIGVNYINPAEAFVKDGIFSLDEEYATDGLHLTYQANQIVKEYYYTHT